MKKTILYFVITLNFSFTAFCQQSVDENIFNQKKNITTDVSRSQTLTKIGKSFISNPYVGGTLEGNEKETLVCNLRNFDCWTFVENSFALTISKESKSFQEYLNTLQTLRYRDGKISGYGSRLHYFIEWMYQAEKNGFVKNITKDLGGVRIDKPINFMTRHRSLYAGLKDESSYHKVQEAENRLNLRGFIYIPKAAVNQIESKINEGDIIAITSNIDGLDVNHEGIAVRQNGRIYLLHASQELKKVTITDEPLAEYLNRIKKHSGIMVLRLVE